MTPSQTYKAKMEEFDEKFNNINKTVVSIETLEGFNEQKPAISDLKSHSLQTTIAVLEAVREECEKRIGNFGDFADFITQEIEKIQAK